MPCFNNVIYKVYRIMKKLSFSIIAVCCMLLGFSLSSCSDDDSVLSTNVVKTDLTAPMFLFANPSPSEGIASIIKGFDFWSFNDSRAAKGRFTTKGTRAYLECSALYSTWSIENGVLTVGGTSYQMTKTSVLGVTAYTIGNVTSVYFPSNNSVADIKAEDIFTKLNYDKSRLWRALEKAKASESGGVYMDEVE